MRARQMRICGTGRKTAWVNRFGMLVQLLQGLKPLCWLSFSVAAEAATP
jgi:hypothetical protein